MKVLKRCFLAISLATMVSFGSAATFNSLQDVDVTSSGWNWVGVWDYTAGAWQTGEWYYQYGTHYFNISYNRWFGAFVYDYNLGYYDEVLYLLNENF